MSTIKSSAENLTLNADGANNDIIFQSNGSNVATLDQAGLLTATTFAGSGASLTALPAAQLTGTLPAISGANLTGISGSSDYRPTGKPIIINGDMQVAQRGASFAHPDTNNDAFPVDRFTFQTGAIGVYTSIQESLTSGAAFEAGFKKAARIDCTTAQASPASGDYFWFQHIIEAQDCLAFKKGTSNAETMTVAFWVKSNKTGTSQLTVKDGDNDRICAGTYAISVANTWEHKVINIAADTTGAFNNDNGAGYKFEWWLGGGTTYTSGTAPTAWEARTDADRGANHLAINDNTANDWAITGIQVEVGTYTAATLPPFQFESFGDNLARCKRYYEKTYAYATAVGHSDTSGDAAIGFHVGFMQENKTTTGMEVSLRPFMVEKRANPTVVIYSLDGQSGKWTRWTTGWGVASHTTGLANELAATGFKVTVNSGTTSNGALGHWTANSEL